jgi:hypothetical protein
MVAAGLLPAIAAPSQTPAPAQGAAQMSAKLLRNIDGFWSQQIAALGGQYRPPSLISFTQPARSGLCEVQAALSGPFYCPINETVYLDHSFLQQLAKSAAAQARFALGYVVAHEVAHHVQNSLGTTALVDQARARSTPELARRTLRTLELQANCYAGLWARWANTHGTLKVPTDAAAMLSTVAAFSHAWQSHLASGQEMLDPLDQGSAAQRLKWFQRGFDVGRFSDCDTFGAETAGEL